MNDERVMQPFVIYSSGGQTVVIPPGNYEFDDYGFDVTTGAQRKYAGRLSTALATSTTASAPMRGVSSFGSSRDSSRLGWAMTGTAWSCPKVTSPPA